MPPYDLAGLLRLETSTCENFPLLHLRPGRPVRWWSSELAGPRALAVSEGHALLAGGYGADVNRLALVTLDGKGNGDAVQTVATWRLPLIPRGVSTPRIRLPSARRWSSALDDV